MKITNKPPIEIIFHSSIRRGASVSSVSWVDCESITILPREKFASEPEDETFTIIFCRPSEVSSVFPFTKTTKSVITLPLLNHWTTHMTKPEILFSKAVFNAVSSDDLRELYSGLFTLAYCDFHEMLVIVNLPLNLRGLVVMPSWLSRSLASLFSVGDSDNDDDADDDCDDDIVMSVCWDGVTVAAIVLSLLTSCDRIVKTKIQGRKMMSNLTPN